MQTNIENHPSSFYLYDEEGARDPSTADKRGPPINIPAHLSSLSRTSSRASESLSMDNFVLFPIENSHSYSYAHLSPNSLALRLNVLKRSLEILNERPDWAKLLKSADSNNNSDDEGSAPASPHFSPRTSSESTRRIHANRPLIHRSYSRSDSADHSQLPSDKVKLSSNASSAALSELLRPKPFRANTSPLCRETPGKPSLFEIGVPKSPVQDWELDEASDEFTDDLKDIIELIERDSNELSAKKDIAATLHDLSLSSGPEDTIKKQNALKTKLLFALATPFVESAGMATAFWGAPPPTSVSSNPPTATFSSTALSMLTSPSSHASPVASSGNRPFHAISSGKHTSPQSIVTVQADFPWSFKAANDLACLMFGVSKSMIKNVTLIDLIAPQFRKFVTDRMVRASGSLDQDLPASRNIIFAGEVLAISRHSEGDFAWTSIWAQKKDDLIIFMFEQITCDAFDMVISSDIDSYSSEPYKITSTNEIAGTLISKSRLEDTTDLSIFSESISEDLNESATTIDSNSSPDWKDSEMLNHKRYFTLQLGGKENIPCALSSEPLEKNDDKYEIKLKIHSMPYIAGMFVVDFLTLKVLSCNRAIAKNLFGISQDEIIDSSIDKVIPNFSKILKAGVDDLESGVRVVPGLVLPEHFFRKYDAILKRCPNEKKSTEELFLSSRGIKGLHRDGKKLFIDVQLRVVRADIFVLWVTYSRHSNKNIHRQIHKLTNSGLSGASSPLKRERSFTRVNLPSQMKLFPEDEGEILELGSSSAEVSRHSSTRKPRRALTFTIPVTYIGDRASKKEHSVRDKFNSLRSVSVSESTSLSSKTEKSSTPPSSVDTQNTESSFSSYYKTFKEEEILAAEKKELEQKSKGSSYWPTVIGERKRSKKFAEFKVLKKMGEGAYGKVVLAEHKKDADYTIIIKCIDKSRILVDTWVRDRQLGTIPSEIQVMATLNHEPHPNIMRIVDYFEDPDYYYLETPVFGNPPAIDLFDFIEVKSDISELDCQLIFKQVTSAIYHLHKHGIVHRDIKDENIIVNEFGVVKLIDFGSAGYVKSGPFDVFVGTIDYASPEVLRGEKYEGKPQDIWALGILLYTMIYKENPFYNVDEIMEGELRVPYVVSKNSLDLIKRMLVRDIANRPTITDVAEHEWLNL